MLTMGGCEATYWYVVCLFIYLNNSLFFSKLILHSMVIKLHVHDEDKINSYPTKSLILSSNQIFIKIEVIRLLYFPEKHSQTC